MNEKNSIFFRHSFSPPFFLSVFLMSVVSETASGASFFSSLFVDPQWLAENLNHSGFRLVQVGGDTYYPTQHIPGAVYLDYKTIVTNRDLVPGVRADTRHLAALFGKIGISRETPVLAYDLSGGMDAARFIWTLATLGHEQGAVLDGGFASWYREGRAMESTVPTIKAVVFEPRPNADTEMNGDQVMAISQDNGSTHILDTRSPNEYRGLSLRGPRGHIAGATHLDWVDTLADRNDPKLKKRETLLAMFSDAGVSDPDQEVVVYCETGHRASQTWLLMRHLGFKKVRLFDGSIAEWRVRNLPVVAGLQPR